MAQEIGDYRKLLTEFIQKQMVIFGPHIALDRARSVHGLSVQDNGSVADVSGDPQLVLRALANEYAFLSPEVSRQSLELLTQKYSSSKNA